MPSVIPFIVKAYTAFVATAVGAFIAKAALVVGLSILSSKLFGPKIPNLARGLSPKSTTVRSAIESRKIVYGRALVSGPVAYHNLSGSNGQHAWYVIPLCDGESDAIEALWPDGDEIPAADIDWTPGVGGADGTGTGAVSTAKWLGSNSPATSAVRTYWTLGHDDQVAMSKLTDAFTDWTTDHRGRGITYGVVQLLFDENTEKIWEENGQPNNIRWLVRGRKVYDRRRDALNSDPDFDTVGKAIGVGLRWFGDDAQTTLIDAKFSVVSQMLTVTDNDATPEDAFSERIAVDVAKLYTVQCELKRQTGDRTVSLGVTFYDAASVRIDEIVSPSSDATGWAAIVGNHYYQRNLAPTGSFVIYSETFGPGGTASIPTGAAFMSVALVLIEAGSTSTTIEVKDAIIFEGTARHDFAMASTWEWTDNPPTCLADYLTQIRGVPYSHIHWMDFIDAAQDSDPLVEIPPAASPANTETRFTINGALIMGDSHKSNIEAALSSFDAKLRWKQGKWSCRASVWRAPDLTIDGDWLTDEAIELQGQFGRRERFNTIEGFFFDPDREHEVVEFPQVTSAAYVARDDGETIPYELDLPMTNSVTMAQRIAFRLLEQGNNQIATVTKLNAKAAQLAIGDTVNVDWWPLGWTDGGNLIDNSRNLSTWDKQGVNLTGNAAFGPFGLKNMWKITADSAGGESAVHEPDPHAPGPHTPGPHLPGGSGGGGGSPLLSVTHTGAGIATGMLFAVWIKEGVASVDMMRIGVRNDTPSPAQDLLFVTIDGDGNIVLEESDIANTANYARVDPWPDGTHRVLLFLRDGISAFDDLTTFIVSITTTIDGDYFYAVAPQFIGALQYNPLYVETIGTPETTIPKTMRVVEWAKLPDGRHSVSLKEDDQSDYADPLVAEYTTIVKGVITAPTLVVAPPSGLTTTSTSGGVKLSWTDPPSRLYQWIEVWASDDNDRNNAVLIASVKATPFLHELIYELRTQYYWLRAVDHVDKVSDWHPLSATAGVSGRPAADPGVQLMTDPDFDLSSALPNAFWLITENTESGSSWATTVTIVPDGVQGSNAVEFRPAELAGSPQFTRAVIAAIPRFRGGAGKYEIRIRYKASSGSTWTNTFATLRIYKTETGPNHGGEAFLFTITADGDWKTATHVFNITDLDTRFINIHFQAIDSQPLATDVFLLDSMFLYPVTT